MLTDADRVGLGRRLWITDRSSAALVGPDGTVDWLAATEPGARPLLGRLLDPSGAAVRVGPVREASDAWRTSPPSRQAYRPGSLVAETTIDAPDGRLLLVDAVTAGDGPARPGGAGLVRLATALSGPMEVEVEVLPPASTRKVDVWSTGLAWPGLAVHCGLRPEPTPLGEGRARWRATCRLDAGQSLVVTLDGGGGPGPLSPDAARALLARTTATWRRALDGLVADGPYREAVERAALVLLGSSPSGGPVAAGTTSLPRVTGGERNEEGRVVLLRHAAGAVAALARIGLADAAEAAEVWLRHAVTDLPRPWPPAVAPDGHPATDLQRWELRGWRHSAPVVAGVDPDLIDLGLLGDVVGAVSASTTGPGGAGGDGPLVGALPALAAAADDAVDRLDRGRVPADGGGVWGRMHPGPSAATALHLRSGLDGLVRLVRSRRPLDLAVVPWHEAAADLLHFVEDRCLGPGPALEAGPGGGTDAALLRVAWTGPWPATHPVVVGTVARVAERLGTWPLVHRLSDDVGDGRPGPDGPDVEAGLWLVRAEALQGRWEDAHDRLEAILSLAGVGGLLGGTAVPATGDVLGNRPATGAHLALLDAVAALGAGPR